MVAVVVAVTTTGHAWAREFPAKVTVSPTSPRVNEAVKITFHAPHSLSKKGFFSVVIRGVGSCKASAAKFDIAGPQRANGRFVVILRPTDQIGPRTLHKWCRGKAKAQLVESRGSKVLGTLATRKFRFRAM